MEYIICLAILIVGIVLLKLVFKINIKKAKEIQENKALTKISDKFPDNIDLAKEYLELLDNKDVEIEEDHDTKTSLYIVATNKIIIADMKNNYARLQTIAHECIHSVQDRVLLLFNFIFSNITIIYFLVAVFLTIFKIFDNIMLQIFIFTFLALIQFSVRSFLEIDAMTRSKFLVKEYMEKKEITTKEETDELLSEYEKINKIGIPFVIDNLLTMYIFRIIIYVVIGMIV